MASSETLGVSRVGEAGRVLVANSARALRTSNRTNRGRLARWLWWTASLLAIAPPGVLGQSPQNIIIFGTGVNTPGNLLADGSVDPHYTLRISADPGFPGPNAIVVNSTGFPIPPWLADGPNSKWIAPQSNQTGGNAAGNYTYRTTFNLSNLNPSTAVLTGQYSSDNTATMLLNGLPVGPTSTCLCVFTQFTISSGFQAGVNTLDFVVNNAGSSTNPTGLRVEIGGTATALTTIAVFGTGVNTSGSLLADGSVDPHYVLLASADPGFPGPNAFVVNSTGFPIPPWLADGPNSKWIGPQTNQTSGNAAGNYTYRTTFDLTNLNPSSVVLNGQYSSDHTATMSLNGVPVGPTSTCFCVFTAFTIASGFQTGVNTLDFVMNNAGTTTNPTGLRVDLSGTVGGSGAVAAPSFNPGTGTYTSAQTVTISTTTTGASIRYTTDNSTPSSTAGTLYSGPITVGSSLTVKAIAYKTGMTASAVTSATYTISPPVAAPTFNPGTGTYTSAQTVAIGTTTTGASIRYTLDGSAPSSTAGTLYTGPITVGSTLTVKAIAYKTGMADSAVSSATYTLNTCSPCVQGTKVDAVGAPFTNPGASIAIDGSQSSGTGTSSYSLTVTAGTHTVTSSVPTGYYAYYSLCTNCMDHTAAGGHPFHLGATVTFNVPAGNFVDVRWEYMQPQPVPQSFRDCVNPTNPVALDSAPAVICTLPIGPWSVPAAAPIIVGRSNVTVQGGSTDMNGCDTILIRDYPDPLHTMEMMVVDRFSAPLKGITIQYLHFEGNLSLAPLPPRAVDIVDKACKSHQGEGIIVPPLCGGCSDLAIKNVNSSVAYIPDPFNPPAGYSYGVTINNCAFENAPGHAITIFPTNIGTIHNQANDIYIHDNDISTAATTGIRPGVNDTLNYEDKANCDDPDALHQRNPAFMDDPGVSVPRNIRIENNTFRNNNGAAVAGLARWAGIRNNLFNRNYLVLQNDITPAGVDLAGGSIYLGQCADKAQIYNNKLIGPATWPKTGGLELWGRNLDVSQNNEITGYPNEGIAANSLLNGTITNNNIHDNNTSFVAGNPTFDAGGISVWTQGTPAACDPVRRDTTNLTVTGNISTGASQAYGIRLGHANHSTNNTNMNTLSGNTLSPFAISGFCFDPNVTYTSLSLVDPVPIKCPDQPLPAPPDAVSISPVCPTGPTAPSQTFTFTINEDTGASNVWWVQPFFSNINYTAGATVKPGNGAGGCHVIFYASNGDSTNPQGANALYLDGDAGGNSWVASLGMPVGTGGVDVSNSTCTVHAGSPNSKVEKSGNKLTLTLEVEFLKKVSNQTFFGYLSAENNQQVKTNDPKVWAELGTWTVPIIP